MLGLDATWRTAWTPPDRRPIYQWAAQWVEMPAVLTIHGRFNPELSRHFLAVFDALQDDHVRQVVLLKPARGGGTLISDVWHCWARANDPGPAMAVLQTDDIAGDHAEARLMPMLSGCEVIKPLLPTNRHQQRSTEIIFGDGLPFYCTGPSISKLQTKGIRYMSLDEAWLYKPGIVDEAIGRLGDYQRMQTSKLFAVSQAGEEDDALDRLYKEGHRAEWHVRCQKCDQLFEPRWTGRRADGSVWGMRWDELKDERGMWKVRECCDTIRYECPHCAHPHIDGARTKEAWNLSGEYVATNPQAPRSKRSFHWRATIDFPWLDLVGWYLESLNAWKLGMPDPLIVFFQKRMAEPRSERTLLEGAVTFKRTVITADTPWDEEAMRFLTVDRQEEDLFWLTVRAWARTGESRRLFFGKVFGFAAVKEIQERFKVQNVFVDSGYMPKGDTGVYAACIRHGWTSVKGTDDAFFWHHTKRGQVQKSYAPLSRGDPESGTSNEGRHYANLIRFSASRMADRVHMLLSKNLWVEPAGHEDDLEEQEYRRQMSSEFKKRKVDKFTGKMQWVWVCPSGNNHAFDCAKMQVLAATLADLLPDQESVSDQELQAT